MKPRLTKETASKMEDRRMVTIRVIVEYQVEVPKDWSKDDIEFHRNDSSWCTSNIIKELEELDKSWGCLCGRTKIEYVGEVVNETR